MLKGALVALSIVFALSLPAQAAPREGGSTSVSVVPHSPSAFAQEVAVVETRPSTAGIIARDAIAGALLGTAVGGGVVLWRRYVNSPGEWGNWQRDLALGAGIGLAAGLIFGAVDAASNADRVFVNGPVADERQLGYAPALATYGRRF
jgi:hypothetical protein